MQATGERSRWLRGSAIVSLDVDVGGASGRRRDRLHRVANQCVSVVLGHVDVIGSLTVIPDLVTVVLVMIMIGS